MEITDLFTLIPYLDGMHRELPDHLTLIDELKQELRTLTDQQFRILKGATFGGLSDDEAKDYDNRQRQITKLIERLAERQRPV
jgi:hypothetical protein